MEKQKVKPKKQKISFALKREIKKQSLHPPILELLVVVTNRGLGQEVADFLEKIDVDLSIVSFGSGTAPSSLANLFGLYNKEKEMIFSVIQLDESERILDMLEAKFLFDAKYAAIAFTIPLKSATNHSVSEFVK